MAEFIKLRSKCEDTPTENGLLGEYLKCYEAIFEEIAILTMKASAERSGRNRIITFICMDVESVILATSVAHIVNNKKYNIALEVNVVLENFEGQYVERISEYKNSGLMILVAANMDDADAFLRFKENVDYAVDQDEHYPVLLTLSTLAEDPENSRYMMPQSIKEFTDAQIGVLIRDCLGCFAFCIGT